MTKDELIDHLAGEVLRLKDDIEFMRNEWHPFSSRMCRICLYREGVFIQKCRLHALIDENTLYYDRLYREWRVKNEACNLAYAITIPDLKKEVERLRSILETSFNWEE